MTFDNINNPDDCGCLSGCKENTSTLFGRRAYKPTLKNTDFKSMWEKGKGTELKECKSICGYKGVSVTKYSDENRETSLNLLAETVHLAPNYMPNVLIVKFKKSAGVIKSTPTKNPLNPDHHDFYKSDDFSVELLELVESINLIEYVQAK